MTEIPKELAEALAKDIPDFVKAIDTASNDGIDMMMTLDAFNGEPVLLYTALWYAQSKGVAVMITAKPVKEVQDDGKETVEA